MLSFFDIIGDIVIIEFFEEFMDYGKVIGEVIFKVYCYIKVVFVKGSKVFGEYCIREFIYFVGEKRIEIFYCENGIRLKFDIVRVYYIFWFVIERMRVFERI